jgi:hypothetical protein
MVSAWACPWEYVYIRTDRVIACDKLCDYGTWLLEAISGAMKRSWDTVLVLPNLTGRMPGGSGLRWSLVGTQQRLCGARKEEVGTRRSRM